MIYSTSEIIAYDGKYFVEIYLNDQYWDHRKFSLLAEAEAFKADPLKADRDREIRAANFAARNEKEMTKYRAMSYTRVSLGRRIGRKPGAS